MAQARLWLRQAHEGNVPSVCVCCGGAAAVYKNNTVFVGLGGLPFLIIPIPLIIFIRAGRIWLRLPFCRLHRHHWLWRRSLAYGTFVISLLLPILTFPFVLDSMTRFQAGHPVRWLGCSTFFLPVLWFAWISVYRKTGVRLAKYDDETVTLEGISQEFVDAIAASPQTSNHGWQRPKDALPSTHFHLPHVGH